MSTIDRGARAREVALAWLPAALAMAGIFAVSSVSIDVPVIASFPFKDKGAHFVVYAVLGFFCAHATLRTWPDRPAARTIAVGAFVAAAWGLSDELHQAFVPGRSAEVLDLVADALGASTGALARWFFHRRSVRRSADVR